MRIILFIQGNKKKADVSAAKAAKAQEELFILSKEKEDLEEALDKTDKEVLNHPLCYTHFEVNQ